MDTRLFRHSIKNRGKAKLLTDNSADFYKAFVTLRTTEETKAFLNKLGPGEAAAFIRRAIEHERILQEKNSGSPSEKIIELNRQIRTINTEINKICEDPAYKTATNTLNNPILQHVQERLEKLNNNINQSNPKMNPHIFLTSTPARELQITDYFQMKIIPPVIYTKEGPRQPTSEWLRTATVPMNEQTLRKLGVWDFLIKRVEEMAYSAGPIQYFIKLAEQDRELTFEVNRLYEMFIPEVEKVIQELKDHFDAGIQGRVREAFDEKIEAYKTKIEELKKEIGNL